MEVRTLTVEIKVDGPFCSKGQERCKYMKETTFCNQFCELFHKQVSHDKLAKAYRRLGECMDNDSKYLK